MSNPECPNCGGLGFTAPPVELGSERCPHCDGHGEIRNGQVWKCRRMVQDDHGWYEDGVGYIEFCDGRFADIQDLPWVEYSPITRMKEVKRRRRGIS